MTNARPSRLHHYAFLTKDQEATRAFYEDIIGLPLVATWSEADEIFGAHREYCHTFFALGDGSALAFFQFAEQADQEQFDPDFTPTPFRHIALNVTADVQRARSRRASPSRDGTRARGSSTTATADRSTPSTRTAFVSSSPSTRTTPTRSRAIAKQTLTTR